MEGCGIELAGIGWDGTVVVVLVVGGGDLRV